MFFYQEGGFTGFLIRFCLYFNPVK